MLKVEDKLRKDEKKSGDKNLSKRTKVASQ
jgi:hypothetical protein